MRSVFVLGALFSLALVGQSAADSTATTGASAAPEKKDPIICHQSGATTGSRLGGHRVCMKASEWQKQQDEDRQALQALQQQSNQSNCTPALAGGQGGC